MRRAAILIVALAGVGAAAAYALTAPTRLTLADLPAHTGDPARGETLYHIGGCASCHAAPGATEEARDVLAGGLALKTDFGTFIAPNISSHPTAGIGGWSDLDFANAMLRGVSPAGRHYYPAFPYGSYVRMPARDVMDLFAYLRSLPASDATPPGHDLPFPVNISRGVGLWKWLHLDPAPVRTSGEGDREWERGRYLVEGPGHCGECHTPRDVTGGLDRARWLGGAPSPDGPGRIPDIGSDKAAVRGWSAVDIAGYLASGFTPDYDSAGGAMADVIKNTAQLTDEDRAAMAVYLLSR